MPSLPVLSSVISLLLAFSGPSAAAVAPTEPSSAPGMLDQVRQKLERLRTTFMRTERSRTEAEQALTDAEKSLAEAAREVSASEKAIRRANQSLAELEARRAATERRVRQGREDGERWLRAMYFLAPGDYLKMLLNQEDPGRAGRLAGDYQYLMQRRSNEIAAWQAVLVELADDARRIEERRDELSTLGAGQTAMRQRLALLKQERAQALSVIAGQARGEQERIEELKRAEQRLSAVVEELRRADSATKTAPESPSRKSSATAAVPAEAVPAASGNALLPDEMQALMPDTRTPPRSADPANAAAGFAALKGSLPLPLDLIPAVRFGQSRPTGSLRTQGLVFHAEEGSPVRAVARGRVVYADWLKGFGLLLIVDHGDGYMSLYGHNRSTDKRVGEKVESGDVIASVGESGGQERPTLYFEIRHQGRPDDPLLWCRAP